MFQLTDDEFQALRSQTAISNKKGGRRDNPYVFTEQGVAILSSVLGSPLAIQVNIQIMRTFVMLRELVISNKELAQKLAQLESKYDGQFQIVFNAIRELMSEPEPRNKPIGFGRN